MVKNNNTSLSANITCDVGDKIWKMNDPELIRRVIKDLENVGLIEPKDVIDGFVSRLPYAYPVYDLDYKAHLETVRKYFNEFPNFHLVGRTGNFGYINADKVIEEGLGTADKIILRDR